MTIGYGRIRTVLLRAAFLALFAATGWLLATPAPAAAQVSALKAHDTAQAIDITADRLEVRENENIAVFSGAVEALQGDLRISADSITVYYDKADGSGSPTISRLDMAGNAKMVSPSEQTESEWAVYDVGARLLTLGGAVVLTRGDTVVRGDRLELDLESGVTKFEGAPVIGAETGEEPGRVRGRFAVPDQGEEDSTEKTEKKTEEKAGD